MLTCLHRRVVGEHIMNQQRQLHANFNRIFNPASVIIKKSLTLTHKIIWTSIHFDMNIWAKDWPFTTLRRKYDFQKKKKWKLYVYIYIYSFLEVSNLWIGEVFFVVVVVIAVVNTIAIMVVHFLFRLFTLGSFQGSKWMLFENSLESMNC